MAMAERELLESINSPSSHIREDAAQAILSPDFPYFVDYDIIIPKLLLIAQREVQPSEEYYVALTPRNLAIRALGRLQAREAVPVLIEWLVPKEGQNLVMDRLMQFGHAGYALVDIGKPAVGPLIQTIMSQGTSKLGNECLKVAVEIIGTDELAKVISERMDQVLKSLRSHGSMLGRLHP